MVKRMQTVSNSIKEGLASPAGLPTLPRLVAVTAAVVALAGGAVEVVGRVAQGRADAVLGPGPASPADLVTLLVALLALAALGWASLGALVGVVGALPGAVGARADLLAAAVTPRLVRRLLVAALGVGIATSPVAMAATSGAATVHGSAQPAATGDGTVLGSAPDPGLRAITAPEPGWVPTAPTHRPQPSPDLLSGPPPPAPVDPAVVVRRGDTLWAIAARHLGAGASAAEVAQAWPRWYAANRDVIGPDPDLIRPGQRLRAPAATP
jgi:hypothetical protein